MRGCIANPVATWLQFNIRRAIGGKRKLVALIDNESVVIGILWPFLTPTVGVNSLGPKINGNNYLSRLLLRVHVAGNEARTWMQL